MKKILLSFMSLALVLTLGSCDLDEPNYGKTTSDNFYKKQSDINEALTGAYLQLRNTWNEYALNFYFVGDCSTDDALKGSSDGDRAEVMELSNFTVYTTNGEVGRRWEILYRLINRCNDVIANAPTAQGDKELLPVMKRRQRPCVHLVIIALLLHSEECLLSQHLCSLLKF